VAKPPHHPLAVKADRSPTSAPLARAGGAQFGLFAHQRVSPNCERFRNRNRPTAFGEMFA